MALLVQYSSVHNLSQRSSHISCKGPHRTMWGITAGRTLMIWKLCTYVGTYIRNTDLDVDPYYGLLFELQTIITLLIKLYGHFHNFSLYEWKSDCDIVLGNPNWLNNFMSSFSICHWFSARMNSSWYFWQILFAKDT